MDTVKDIFLFGSMKDGFKAYKPTNRFDHFYNSSASGWQITIEKTRGSIWYIYVLYDILTSHEEGRTGSCFGIAIELENQFFLAPNKLYEDFFDLIVSNIIARGIVLQRLPGTGKIAFNAFNFTQVQEEADDLIFKIREHIQYNLAGLLAPAGNTIPEKHKTALGLHHESSNAAIMESFIETGAVILSPRFQRISVTFSDLLSQKDRDLGVLKEQIAALESLKNTEYRLHSLQSEYDLLKQQYQKLNVDYERLLQQSGRQVLPVGEKQPPFLSQNTASSTIRYGNSAYPIPDEANTGPATPVHFPPPWYADFRFKVIALALLIAISMLSAITYFTCRIPYDDKPESSIPPPRETTQQNNRPEKQTRTTPGYHSDEKIRIQAVSGDSVKGFLEIRNFLEAMRAQKKAVSDPEEVFELIEAYVQGAPSIVSAYGLDQDSLSRYMRKNNQTSKSKLKNLIDLNLKQLKITRLSMEYTIHWHKAIGGNEDLNKASLILFQKKITEN